MVASIVALCAASQPTFAGQIDRTARSIENWTRGSVTVQASLKTAGKVESATYELKLLAPRKALIRIREPRQGRLDEIDSTFFVDGASVIAYDAITNERLKRQATPQNSLYARYGEIAGAAPEAVRALLDRDFTIAFLSGISRGRKATNSGRSWSFAPIGKTKGSARVSFDERNLPTSIRVTNANGELNWSYKYGVPPSDIAYAPPRDSRLVGSFIERLAPPKFSDSTARNATLLGFKTYDRLNHAQIKFKDASGTVVVSMSSGRFREDRGPVSWVYDGTMLTILDSQKRTAVRGRTGRAFVVERLANAGRPCSSLTKQLINRENPLRKLLPPSASVSSAGEIVVGNVASWVLRIKGSSWDGSALIDKRSGALTNVVSRIRDQRGSVVTTTITEAAYSQIGTPIPASRFALKVPPGYQVSTLPKLDSR